MSFDMAALAAATESVISSVLFGALAGAARLPFQREHYESAIERSGIAVQRSLAGFAAGFERAAGGENGSRHDVGEQPSAPAPAPALAPAPFRRARALLERVSETFPAAAKPLIIEGVRRLADYQDFGYADAYLDRLEQISKLDDGGDDKAYRLSSETGRYLALWMSYEDAIRVADLKIRSARFSRFREEVRAEADQLVYVVEFMHPRVEEICDILPAPLGRFIMQKPSVRKLVDKIVNRGRLVPTAKLRGFLLLYAIASLRPWRRLSYRHRREMVLIDRWLARIASAAPSSYDLALEIARCPRLIKGYGDTHARGMKSFTAIMDVLDRIEANDEAADTVRKLADAALD